MFGGLSSKSQMDRDRSQTDAGLSSTLWPRLVPVASAASFLIVQEPLLSLVRLAGRGERAGELAGLLEDCCPVKVFREWLVSLARNY